MPIPTCCVQRHNVNYRNLMIELASGKLPMAPKIWTKLLFLRFIVCIIVVWIVLLLSSPVQKWKLASHTPLFDVMLFQPSQVPMVLMLQTTSTRTMQLSFDRLCQLIRHGLNPHHKMLNCINYTIPNKTKTNPSLL